MNSELTSQEITLDDKKLAQRCRPVLSRQFIV